MKKLEQFLYDKSMHDAMRTASVICLQTKEYPLLFCRSFITFLATLFNKAITPHYMDSDNDAAVMASLQTTFLGQSSWYWLHADETLSKKSYDMWHDFLRRYTGPNVLIFCTSTALAKVPSSWFVLQLPDNSNAGYFRHIEYIMGIKQSFLGHHIFTSVRTMPLDTAVLLCQYAMLLKKNNETFFATWIPKLLPADVSLFSLSQALFERKSKQFFTQWHQVALRYSPQFWISFWSEQLWRASLYIYLQKSGKKEDARKIGFRLPFAFLQSTWRTYCVSELQEAHHLLYDIDYHLKQGGNEYSLELVYARFFNEVDRKKRPYAYGT